MIKYTVILLNMIGLMLFNLFNMNDVEVSQTVPTSAKAGDEFVIEITVSKGNTGGFAKLQQDLPLGWTAEPVDNGNAGASFTFRNQTAKFIWMSLPSDQEFKVSYKIIVGADAAGGEQIVEGKFAYVFNNVKNTVNFSSSPINIENESAPVAATEEPAEEVAAEETTTPVEETTPEETPAEEPATAAVEEPAAEEPAATETASPEKAPVTEEPVVTAQEEATEEAAPTPEPATATTTAVTEEQPSAIPGISCTRQHPASIAPGAEFTVQIKVVKNDLSGFAKLQEVLPDGFTAEGLETQGASFTFSDQKLKYVWVSLPSMDEFMVSYKVKVAPSVTATSNIDGLFSYIQNDETKKHIIEATTVSINTPTAETPVAAATEEVPGQEEVPAEEETVAVEETPAVEEAPVEEAAPVTETAAVEETTPAVEEPAVEESTPAEEESAIAAATNIPSPETAAVNYKVQICALKKRSVAYTYFQDKYKIADDVYVEAHEGWTKYTTGGFNIYKAARDHRESIRNKGVKGPFVTAYNEGNRITVQEALMITKQQWYK